MRIARGAGIRHDGRVTVRRRKRDAPATARARARGYNTGMDEKPRKTRDIADQAPQGGKTRATDAPFDKDLTDTFNEVQPEMFRGHSRSSVEAAESDPDVEDTKGGE
jgi:hypothetical protein